MAGIPIIAILFIVFFSIVLHEFCHGNAAYLNGDNTAKMMGRLTFNPISHIDPISTLFLPIMLILIRSPIVIGMAKPIPVNPYNFRNYDKGLLNVGLAGPASNIIFGIFLALISRFLGYGLPKNTLLMGSTINFILAFFNLIPIPPLDGSRILVFFLPKNIRYLYERLERYGIAIVIIFILLGGLSWLFPFSARIVSFISGTKLF